MEAVDTPASTLPPAAAQTSTQLQRTSPRRSPVSPKRSIRENRSKRISPKTTVVAGKDATTTRTASKSIRSTTSARPLVPLTERRSHEDKLIARSKRDAEAERWEVAPDGGSAGREGRQFTVANVGNNGRIYLRYESCLGYRVLC